MSSAAESDVQLLPTATGKDDARMGGGMALAKSFKNAMQGEGGGIMHGSMRKSAIRRRKKHQDKLRTEKTDKKRRCDDDSASRQTTTIRTADDILCDNATQCESMGNNYAILVV